MLKNLKSLFLSSLLILTLWLPCFAQEYEIVDLGTLGGNSSNAYDINNNGQVVGGSYYLPDNNNAHAFFWENGQMTDLGTLGGNRSGASGININRQVVGASELSNGYWNAFVWQNGSMTNLGTLGGDNSVANAINDNGVIVGYSDIQASFRAYRWDNGVFTDLGTLASDNSGISDAKDINNNNQIVGTSVTDSQRGYIWENGQMTDLGDPFTTLPDTDFSVNALAINESSKVVGGIVMLNGSPTSDAFVWQNGAFTLLATSDGTQVFDEAFAFDINENDEIVGRTYKNGTAYAVRWYDGEIKELDNLILNNPGWHLSMARAINDSGQIVGTGIINGETHAFLLNPTDVIPEPSTILMFLSGIFGMFWLRKKK